jgi:hypothetical protein
MRRRGCCERRLGTPPFALQSVCVLTGHICEHAVEIAGSLLPPVPQCATGLWTALSTTFRTSLLFLVLGDVSEPAPSMISTLNFQGSDAARAVTSTGTITRLLTTSHTTDNRRRANDFGLLAAMRWRMSTARAKSWLTRSACAPASMSCSAGVLLRGVAADCVARGCTSCKSSAFTIYHRIYFGQTMPQYDIAVSQSCCLESQPIRRKTQPQTPAQIDATRTSVRPRCRHRQVLDLRELGRQAKLTDRCQVVRLRHSHSLCATATVLPSNAVI